MDMGLEQAGMTTVFQCEIDPRCQQVLRRHWPDVPKWDDVSTLTGKHILEQTGGVDLVAWGSPCQDLSVAGKRAGLAGGRSGLFNEGMRIIRELREESNGLFPRFSIWENVVGAISSNGGDDFETVLTEMVESGSHLLEWAILDAQNFGVPQRRRRIFLVSCFDSATAERCPDPLLPVSESGAGNSAKSVKKKSSIAATVEGGFGEGGDGLPLIASKQTVYGQSGFAKYTEGVTTLTATDYKRPEMNIVAPISNEEQLPYGESSFAQYSDGFGTLRAATGTLGGGSETLIVKESALGFSHTQGLDPQVSEQAFPTLRANGNGHAVGYQTNDPDLMPMAVRRLTPLECERLMDWPDDHTRWTADGTELADSHRYRMCGNGVVSEVARWVGQQLMQVVNR
jgi:DNA (cytosine-5)-methyltransferase 1